MKAIARSIFLAGLFPTLSVLLLALTSATAMASLVEIDTDTGFKSVYLSENQSASTVTVALVVLAGEVDVEGPEGLSHYLEHLMFWHADNAGGQKLHARGGNAWVNGIVTSYFNQSEKVDLPDMMEFIARLYTPPDLDRDFMIRERSVVAREYDLGVSENPDRRVHTDILRGLYNKHPVSRSVIGTPESIHSLSIESAIDFHGRYYHPVNSVLFISGDVSQDEAVEAVNEHLGHLAGGNLHAAEWRDIDVTDSFDKTTEFIDDQVNYDRLLYTSLSHHPVSIDAVKGWYTLRLLNNVIDSALEGGVARPLRIDNFILRSFSLDMYSLLNGTFEFNLHAEPDKGVTLPQATKAIDNALREIATKGIPDKTLERVRKRMLQTEQRNIDHQFNNYGRMAIQLSEGISPVSGDKHIEHIKSVSLAEVNQMLEVLASPTRRAIAHIRPPKD